MLHNKLTTSDLLLRCYANKVDGVWQAICIDLCLAAQGDSYEEVKQNIDEMISEYVYDALAGEDQEFADQLLSRRAPFYQIATYYLLKLGHRFGVFRDGFHNLFKTPITLVPRAYVKA